MAGDLDPRAVGARRFEGKIAVVTGAGKGIGAATARRLAQEGASIVIGDMVEETSQKVCADIQDFVRVLHYLLGRAFQVGQRCGPNGSGPRGLWAYRCDGQRSGRDYLVSVFPALHAGTDTS